jgi:hypothetical protein
MNLPGKIRGRVKLVHALGLVPAAALAIAGPAFWPPVPAHAAAWDWATHCFKKPDIDVLHAVIQKMLKNDIVGARETWCSSTGRNGYVYLVEGGDRAGTATATVRITTVDAHGEQPQFTFHYRKDPARGWGVVG